VFLAISIFDKIFSKVFTQLDIDLLALVLVTVTIIAAKIEEPISPSIRRMIALLPPFE
jgi:hypothetical protein